MLTYALLFLCITIIILGVIRASKQNHTSRTHPVNKEPFIGKTQHTETEIDLEEEIETVGKPRIIRHAPASTRESAASTRTHAAAPPSTAHHTPSSHQTEAPVSPHLSVEETHTPTAVEEEISDVIALHLIAQTERPYHGFALLQAMLTLGLRYGKWNIFHRHTDMTGRGPILFSLLSSVEPGTFDLAKMGSFTTPSLTLFMRISSIENPLQVFETLLSTTCQLAEELGGTVCDEQRTPLSTEKLAFWRAQLHACSV